MKTIAEQLNVLNVKEFPFIIKDNDGKRVYFESSYGYWSKREYKDGNEIYFENSDGDWFKKEFKEGKLVYFENSEGYWWKREYKDGQIVFFEDSYGIIIDNRPNERPCVGKKVTIDGVDYELK